MVVRHGMLTCDDIVQHVGAELSWVGLRRVSLVLSQSKAGFRLEKQLETLRKALPRP
eukprot:COSAG06_NODE_5145_length_3682_cov_3.651130_5_plen_56_part_01